jgi:Fe-Mn family superoxide dismutase
MRLEQLDEGAKPASIMSIGKRPWLVRERLSYELDDLEPVLSEDAMKYHYNKLHKGYVERFNASEGDPDFNEAGAFLHNVLFPQFKKPVSGSRPHGISSSLIMAHFESFENFKDKFKEVAMGIQGSGWVYLSKKGEIKTIVNHEIKNDIALLVDWWEHAWALDYEHDKAKYLDNIWRIINWEVINARLT